MWEIFGIQDIHFESLMFVTLASGTMDKDTAEYIYTLDLIHSHSDIY